MTLTSHCVILRHATFSGEAWLQFLYYIFSALAEFWFDVFKEVLAEIITETISPALGIDGAVEFARKMENSGLIQTITNLLRNFVSTNNP